ncbi:MAG: hypothetical protein WAZ34_08840 [Rhodocyclaceae bacterium]
MPVPALVSVIVSGVIGAAIDAPAQPSPQVPDEMVRPYPAETKRGEMQPPVDGTVLIDGRFMQLAPAAQIRTAQNLIVMPAAIQEPALVRYLTDASGAVFRVWMLTPGEISSPDPR